MSLPDLPPHLTDDDLDRYARHIVLKEIGGMGQRRLKAAKVLIVGLGGIGAPAALYLAAAGIGTLGLLDDDTVSLSNLQRQVLYATGDVGASKAEVAKARLSALNPAAALNLHSVRLTADNAAEIIGGYDIVLDGCDNFETRHLVNRICMAWGKTLVSGALGRFSGQVAVFRGAPCYHCFVPDIPPDAETCERVGIVGALAGIIGAMCALEVVKLVAGAGEPLLGKLLIFDGLSMTSRVIALPPEPDCPICGDDHD
ncbi:molybdopterin-synthase adenylyltransferase MoeB [Asticcacaulis sp. AND118]|uniref:HesA/MoeB/ThiF family protein n=1 Tax=Asticcacaulis sp. AND118 TaxID=2840468 RepID=UPI001CFFC0A8|nr:molybdopterin-synthase adenylyltransferase MoeB [Asticcacaulis sp. AND118]UDF04166.1 molybdopterin-synthase adenylyltransferase MoeB [Asticcacaulis sp. AND118]